MRRQLPLLSFLVATFFFHTSAQAQVSVWRPTGGPAAGNMTNLAQTADGTVWMTSSQLIWRSTDLGLTWTQSNLGIHDRPDNQPAAAISSILATSEGIPCVSTQIDLACSRDGGVTWQYVEHTSGQRGGFLEHLIETSDGTYIGSSSSKIWRSTDKGSSWVSVYDTDGAGTLHYDGTTIWATGRTQHKLRKSTDHGQTWQIVLETGGKSNIFYRFPSGRLLRANGQLLMSDDEGVTWSGPFSTQEWSTVVPMASGRVFAINAGNGSYTDDGGDTWTNFVFDILPSLTITRDCLTPGSTVILCVLDGVGLLRSADSGATWTVPSAAPSAANILSVAEVGNGAVLVGTSEGIHRWDGLSWTWVEKTSDWTRGIAVRGNDVFAGGEDGLFVSNNGGLSFTKRPFNSTVGSQGFVQLFFGPDGLLYGRNGHRELLVSTDDGVTWSEPPNPGDDYNSNHWIIDDSGTWYVGSSRGLWKSDDRAATWVQINDLSSVNNGNPLTVTEFVKSGDNDFFLISSRDLIWSHDGGATWESRRLVTSGSIGTITQTSDGALWVGTDNGALKSTDNGATFEPMVVGTPDGTFGEAVYQGSSGTIYLQTFDAGLYTMGISGVAVETPPSSPTLLVATYPNPFSNRVTVDLMLTEPTDVRIGVYDILGRKIVSKEPSFMTAGQHYIPLNLSELTQGAYFVRVEAGGKVTTIPAIRAK